MDVDLIAVDRSEEAPDFALIDTANREVRLSDLRGLSHVVLVLNRGFA